MPNKEYSSSHEMRLYDRQNRRLYINESERMAFVQAAQKAPLHIEALCLTLLYSGCRLSEALELKVCSLQIEDKILAVRSLKKRSRHHVREIPVPEDLVKLLRLQAQLKDRESFLWSREGEMVHRVTAYRWIKEVMQQADIHGAHASPKGLRHSYGVHAVRCGIVLNLIQRWMGHASIKTTAIYANAVGAEEREIAQRMW